MWAEAALQLAEGEQERQYVARGLDTVRRAHNLHWVGSRARAARSYNTLCAGPARTRKLPQRRVLCPEVTG